LQQKEACSLQLPFLSSKNHSRLSGSRVIQSSSQASIDGRIVSSKSYHDLMAGFASLGLDGVSLSFTFKGTLFVDLSCAENYHAQPRLGQVRSR
jgi:hypothetical protein